jgi:hypothetical protein
VGSTVICAMVMFLTRYQGLMYLVKEQKCVIKAAVNPNAICAMVMFLTRYQGLMYLVKEQKCVIKAAVDPNAICARMTFPTSHGSIGFMAVFAMMVLLSRYGRLTSARNCCVSWQV